MACIVANYLWFVSIKLLGNFVINGPTKVKSILKLLKNCLNVIFIEVTYIKLLSVQCNNIVFTTVIKNCGSSLKKAVSINVFFSYLSFNCRN